MNIEHFQHTINLLKYTAKDEHFSLKFWLKNYGNQLGEIPTSIKELNNTCGATACIGGYLSLSKRYRKWANYPEHYIGEAPAVFSGEAEGERRVRVAINYNAIELYWNTNYNFTRLLCSPDFDGEVYNAKGIHATRKEVYNKLPRVLHKYKTDARFAWLVDGGAVHTDIDLFDELRLALTAA